MKYKIVLFCMFVSGIWHASEKPYYVNTLNRHGRQISVVSLYDLTYDQSIKKQFEAGIVQFDSPSFRGQTTYDMRGVEAGYRQMAAQQRRLNFSGFTPKLRTLGLCAPLCCIGSALGTYAFLSWKNKAK
jgi:hypothetical protein